MVFPKRRLEDNSNLTLLLWLRAGICLDPLPVHFCSQLSPTDWYPASPKYMTSWYSAASNPRGPQVPYALCAQQGILPDGIPENLLELPFSPYAFRRLEISPLTAPPSFYSSCPWHLSFQGANKSIPTANNTKQITRQVHPFFSTWPFL